MSGKGKPNGRVKKGAGKPQEPPRVAAEQPAAQPATTLAEDIDTGQKTLTILPTAPAKPSEEAEAVLAVIVEEYESSGGDVEFLANDTMKGIAAALVRRFPGLTRRPGVPRHAYEDTKMAKRGRLPDGSIVVAVWYEAAGTWAGQLVTEPPTGLAGMIRQMVLNGGAHFATSHTGVFGLLKRLDGLYREWLGRQKGGGK